MYKSIMIVVLLASSTVWGATAEQKCQGGKNEAAGKLAECLAKAEKKLAAGAEPSTYTETVTKCTGKFASKWQKLEQSAVDAGTACPTTGDQTQVESFVGSNGATVATALQAGGSMPKCGDNAINVAGEECDGSAMGGETCTSLGFGGGTLSCSTCQLDTSACIDRLSYPASGQTTAYGAGSDGQLQAGTTLSFTDNGDGTITDNRTGLMWEKKDDSGGIHDKDNEYTWGMSVAPYTMNGTMVTTFLAALNAGTGFAGYTDWRIPNIRELVSLLDYQIAVQDPMLSSAFHAPATCTGCTDVTAPSCSCSSENLYWSSSTQRAATPSKAWTLAYTDSELIPFTKSSTVAVRAVRGGL